MSRNRGQSFTSAIRVSGSRYLRPASAVLLLLAGAYVVHYWLTAGGCSADAARTSSGGR